MLKLVTRELWSSTYPLWWHEPWRGRCCQGWDCTRTCQHCLLWSSPHQDWSQTCLYCQTQAPHQSSHHPETLQSRYSVMWHNLQILYSNATGLPCLLFAKLNNWVWYQPCRPCRWAPAWSQYSRRYLVQHLYSWSWLKWWYEDGSNIIIH